MENEKNTDLLRKIWPCRLQLISKCNKGFRFLLCVIDIYNKYMWVDPLKDKKILQLLMIFKKY